MIVNIFLKTRVPPAIRKHGLLLKKAVRAALGKKKAWGEVNLVLTGNAEIKRLNRLFLSRTGLTDVIAFNHPKPAFTPRGEKPPFGDIYICLPVSRRQAAKMGHSLETELLILSVHGTLHLSGMDDATTTQRKAMNAKTISILKTLV